MLGRAGMTEYVVVQGGGTDGRQPAYNQLEALL